MNHILNIDENTQIIDEAPELPKEPISKLDI